MSIFDHRLRFHGKDLVVGELFVVIGDQLSGSGKFLLRNQKVEEMHIERLLLRIARDPGPVLGHGSVFREALGLNDTEDALKRLPGALLRGLRQLLCRNGRGGRDQR